MIVYISPLEAAFVLYNDSRHFTAMDATRKNYQHGFLKPAIGYRCRLIAKTNLLVEFYLRRMFFDSLSYGLFFLLSAFNMATDLATDPEYQLFVSSKCYEAAYEILTSEALKDLSPEKLAQVLKRLGNIRNEMGVFYMNQAAALQTEKEGGEYSILPP